MKFLLLALTIILFSCSKNADVANPIIPIDSTQNPNITLGIQREIFGSTHHTFANILDANNNRLFFATYNTNNSSYEFYAGNAADTSYQLLPYGNPSYFTIYSAMPKLKPNGDIICILRTPNLTGQDSVITLINRVNTNSWVPVKKELYNSFWDQYYFNSSLFIYTTSTGRLVLTGQTKAAVSDDNGLNWHETFTIPAGFLNMEYENNYTSGSRNFIISDSKILYSDDNFETGHLVSPGTGTIMNKPVKLDDQRLVIKDYSTTLHPFYQSLDNGQSWSLLPLVDPVDSLNYYSNSYFCFVSGTTIRTRAKYIPCNSYYTVDIDPSHPFTFYPLTRPTCPGLPSADAYIKSCQRPDRRMYYAIETTIGTLSYFGIKRDY